MAAPSTRWLIALIFVAMIAGRCCATVGIAIDVDSRDPLGGPVPAEVVTQAKFVSWDLTGVENVGSTSLTEQGVTFTLLSWSSLSGGYPLFSRIRTSFDGGGGGGEFNELLTDFAWFDTTNPPEPDRPGFPRRDSGLLLVIEGLDPGEYRMTSWHFDSLVFEAEQHIRIAIGNQSEPSDDLIESFRLGTSAASYDFDVSNVGQVIGLYYLITVETKDFPFFRSRFNGFTLVSVPEPAPFLLMLSGLSVGLSRRFR